MSRFILNQPVYNDITKNPKGMVGQHLNKLGARVERLAKAQVGKKTHALQRSINHNVSIKNRGLVVTIGSNNKIALLHHKGARPHIITPRHAKTLRFYSRGRIVYAKVVHHPGTKPNRYLTDNLAIVVR